MKILRFTASWCQPCKQLAKQLELAALDAEIEVIDIDVLPEVAAQYGIRSVPTLIAVDAQGGVEGTLIGAKTSKEILDWFADCA